LCGEAQLIAMATLREDQVQVFATQRGVADQVLSWAGPPSKDPIGRRLTGVGKPRRDSQLDSERLIVAISGKFGQGVPAIAHNAVRKPIQGTIRALRDMWIFCSVPFCPSSRTPWRQSCLAPTSWRSVAVEPAVQHCAREL
jgi:hypothetical protein